MRAQSIVAALLCLVLAGGISAKANPSGPSNQPDILILDFVSGSGTETVNLTYPATVPHVQVKRDIAALQTALGCKFYSVHVVDALPPFPGEKTKMTSASFAGVHAFANTPNTIAVEPLILALKPYKHLALHYFVDSGFQFKGLRDYQDKFVTIAFTPASSTYSYDIHITDPGFTKLNLPVYAPDPATVQTAAVVPPTAQPVHRNPWIILVIAVVAVGLGGLVYTVLTRYF